MSELPEFKLPKAIPIRKGDRIHFCRPMGRQRYVRYEVITGNRVRLRGVIPGMTMKHYEKVVARYGERLPPGAAMLTR